MFTRLKSYVATKSSQANKVWSDTLGYSLTNTTTTVKPKTDIQPKITQKQVNIHSQASHSNTSNVLTSVNSSQKDLKSPAICIDSGNCEIKPVNNNFPNPNSVSASKSNAKIITPVATQPPIVVSNLSKVSSLTQPASTVYIPPKVSSVNSVSLSSATSIGLQSTQCSKQSLCGSIGINGTSIHSTQTTANNGDVVSSESCSDTPVSIATDQSTDLYLPPFNWNSDISSLLDQLQLTHFPDTPTSASLSTEQHTLCRDSTSFQQPTSTLAPNSVTLNSSLHSMTNLHVPPPTRTKAPNTDTCSLVWTSLSSTPHVMLGPQSRKPDSGLLNTPKMVSRPYSTPALYPSSPFPSAKPVGREDPKRVCIFCGTAGHGSHACTRYSGSDQFWSHVLKDRRCKNCLRLHHRADACYDQSLCRVTGCSRSDKHSPVLCRRRYSGFNSNSKLSPSNLPQNPYFQSHRFPQSHFAQPGFSKNYSTRSRFPQNNSQSSDQFSQGTQTVIQNTSNNTQTDQNNTQTDQNNTRTDQKSVSTQTVLSWYSHTPGPCTEQDVSLYYAPEHTITPSFKSYTRKPTPRSLCSSTSHMANSLPVNSISVSSTLAIPAISPSVNSVNSVPPSISPSMVSQSITPLYAPVTSENSLVAQSVSGSMVSQSITPLYSPVSSENLLVAPSVTGSMVLQSSTPLSYPFTSVHSVVAPPVSCSIVSHSSTPLSFPVTSVNSVITPPSVSSSISSNGDYSLPVSPTYALSDLNTPETCMYTNPTQLLINQLSPISSPLSGLTNGTTGISTSHVPGCGNESICQFPVFSNLYSSSQDSVPSQFSYPAGHQVSISDYSPQQPYVYATMPGRFSC